MTDIRGEGRRRRRRGPIVVWAIVGVVLIGGALIVADVGARAYAEDRVADELESRLPDSVQGAVDVHIGGASVIGQYLAGSFAHIDIDAPELTVNGMQFGAHVKAEGVPTDTSQPVETLTGAVALGQETLNALIDVPAIGDLTLSDGAVTVTGTQRVFGVELGYQAAATVQADRTRLLFSLTDVSVTAGPAGIDLSRLADRILGGAPIPVCVASFLPEGVDVTDVTIDGDTAMLAFEARDLVLSADTLTTMGSCD